MCVCVGHNDVQVYIRVMCNIGCIHVGYLATIVSLLFQVGSKCSGIQVFWEAEGGEEEECEKKMNRM